jgi:hypothetical protein
MRYKPNSIDEREALVARLCEFKYKYVTAEEVAQRTGVRDTSVYSWLNRECQTSGAGTPNGVS